MDWNIPMGETTQVKGVACGLNVTDTYGDIFEALESETHTIYAARKMRRKGRMAAITFDATKPPMTIAYHCGIIKVHLFKPKALVCRVCHRYGHKSDVCENADPIKCQECGRPQKMDEEYDQAGPLCRNCGGKHLATESSCPRLRE